MKTDWERLKYTKLKKSDSVFFSDESHIYRGKINLKRKFEKWMFEDSFRVFWRFIWIHGGLNKVCFGGLIRYMFHFSALECCLCSLFFLCLIYFNYFLSLISFFYIFDSIFGLNQNFLFGLWWNNFFKSTRWDQPIRIR